MDFEFDEQTKEDQLLTSNKQILNGKCIIIMFIFITFGSVFCAYNYPEIPIINVIEIQPSLMVNNANNSNNENNLFDGSMYNNDESNRLFPWITREYIESLDPTKLLKDSEYTPKSEDTILCDYKGKVFGIGFFKTGTSSVNGLIQQLGYQGLRYHRFISAGYNMPHIWLSPKLEYIYPFDILMILMHPQLLYLIQLHSYIARNFGDSPSLFLYKIFDIWYPNSKFIMSINNDAFQTVNSNMRMYHRDKTKLSYQDTFKKETQFDIALTVTRYNKHIKNVLHYFKNRPNDLLVINLRNDPQAMYKVGQFLGCHHVNKSATFPHANKAPIHQEKEFVKREWYDKIMKTFVIPEPYNTTYNIINNFNWNNKSNAYINDFNIKLRHHYINKYGFKINGPTVSYQKLLEFFDKITNKSSDVYWLTRPSQENISHWKSFLEKTFLASQQ